MVIAKIAITIGCYLVIVSAISWLQLASYFLSLKYKQIDNHYYPRGNISLYILYETGVPTLFKY